MAWHVQTAKTFMSVQPRLCYNGHMAKGTKSKRPSIRRMLLLIETSYGSGREVLSGILKYLADGHPWQIQFLLEPKDLTADLVRNAAANSIDGVILTRPGAPEGMAALADSSLPAVFIDVFTPALSRRPNAAFFKSDNADIGRRGARHLLECGNFSSFGFVHAAPKDAAWSRERCDGFTTAMEGQKAKGRALSEFPSRDDIGSDDDRHALSAWLSALPKPVAVMAAYDWRATHVLDACAEAGLRVPDQVALVGADNDEFYCSFTIPHISSVQSDGESVGLRAAAELDALSRKGRTGPGPVFQIPAKGVVQRESTKFLPPAAALVRRASEFIKSRACEGIVPGDVYRHLRVSRSLAELRFAELRGETIRAAIERERLDRVKKLLKTTDRTLSRIAKEAGFKSATHLSHLFKKRTDLSPSAWRKGRVEEVGEK